jgi:uncharacterized protein YndB with AHSA1/START domain
MKSEIKTMEVKLTRTIPAPPDEVFDAWLDRTCPGNPWSEAAKLVLDPKVDGLFYLRFINQTTEGTPHYGRFTILDRPYRVQHTWMSLNTHGLESLVTVTFQRKDEDTLLTLRHENLPDDEYGRNHEKGWDYFLGRFADRFPRDHDQLSLSGPVRVSV